MGFIEEAVVVMLIPVVSYILKFFIKPSKTEIRLLSQLLSFILVLAIKWARDHAASHINFYKASLEMEKIDNKLSRKDIILG